VAWSRRLPALIHIPHNAIGRATATDTRQLLDIIIQSLDRCQHLELMLIMMGEAQNILMRVGAAQLPKLHELNIHLLRASMEMVEGSGLFTTPSLRKLSIVYLPMRGSNDSFFAPLNWRNLNSLSIGSSIPLGWVHRLLRHCPYLVYCNLKMKDGGSVPNFEPILLPDLRKLCIYQECLNVDNLYSTLGAPGLRTLDCFEIWSARNGTPPSILRLLPGITTLQSWLSTLASSTNGKSRNALCFHRPSSISF